MKLIWLFIMGLFIAPSVTAYYPGYYSNYYSTPFVGYGAYSFSFPHYNYYSLYYVDRGFDYFGRSNLQWSFDDRAQMGERLFAQGNEYGFGRSSYFNSAPSFFY